MGEYTTGRSAPSDQVREEKHRAYAIFAGNVEQIVNMAGLAYTLHAVFMAVHFSTQHQQLLELNLLRTPRWIKPSLIRSDAVARQCGAAVNRSTLRCWKECHRPRFNKRLQRARNTMTLQSSFFRNCFAMQWCCSLPRIKGKRKQPVIRCGKMRSTNELRKKN